MLIVLVHPVIQLTSKFERTYSDTVSWTVWNYKKKLNVFNKKVLH